MIRVLLALLLIVVILAVAWMINIIYALADFILSIFTLILGGKTTLIYDPYSIIIFTLTLLIVSSILFIIIELMRMIRERRRRGGGVMF